MNHQTAHGHALGAFGTIVRMVALFSVLLFGSLGVGDTTHAQWAVESAGTAAIGPVCCSTGQLQVDANTVALYHLNDGTGTVLTDVSGNGNHGTLMSGTWTADGRFDSAILLDGLGDYFVIPSPNTLGLQGGYTIELWVKPFAYNPSTVGPNATFFFSAGHEQYDFHILKIGGADATRFQPNQGINMDGSGITLMDWSHVSASVDNLGTARFYVNGALYAERTGVTIPSISNSINFGRRATDFFGYLYMNGIIDEIRISNIARVPTATVQSCQTELNPGERIGFEVPLSNILSTSEFYSYTIACETGLEFVVDDDLSDEIVPWPFVTTASGFIEVPADSTRSITGWMRPQSTSTTGDTLTIDFVAFPINNSTDTTRCVMEVIVGSIPVGIPDPVPSPQQALRSYPNPFNPQTTIEFSTDRSSRVRLAIYNTSGKLVRILLDEMRPAGIQRVLWDGRSANGTSVPSGVYFARLSHADQTWTRKMVFLK